MKSDIDSPENVKKLVDCFYAKAGDDPLLGPIFSTLRNPTQKQFLYEYWEIELLTGKRTRLHGFPRHIESMFSPQHFIRWLGLFLETIDKNFSGPMADKAKIIVIRKSEEFQKSLELFRF